MGKKKGVGVVAGDWRFVMLVCFIVAAWLVSWEFLSSLVLWCLSSVPSSFFWWSS